MYKRINDENILRIEQYASELNFFGKNARIKKYNENTYLIVE